MAATGCGDDTQQEVSSTPLAAVEGTACGDAVSYDAPSDIKIYFERVEGNLTRIVVADGPFDEIQSGADFETYGQTHDTYMNFNLASPVPFAAGDVTVEDLKDSFVGARGIGLISVGELNQPISLSLEVIGDDEVRLSFVGPVNERMPEYPPTFTGSDNCEVGQLSIAIEGPWQEHTPPM